MKSKSNKLVFAILAIIIFILFFFMLYLPIQPAGNIIEDGWILANTNQQVPIQLPYQKNISDIETVVLSNTISYSEGDVIIFTWLRGQAVEIKLNGNIIYTIGNPAEPTANIWNDAFLIQLPEPAAEENLLEIHITSASFPISVTIPPYIIENNHAQWKVSLIDLVYNNFLLASIGGAFVIGNILIGLSLTAKKGWSAEVFMGLASILGAIESFDYVYRISTINLPIFLVSKKILMVAGYLGVFAFVVGLEKYYRGKLTISKYVSIPTVITVLVLSVQNDLINFSNLITSFNFLFLAEMVIAIVLITSGKRGKDWLIIPAMWLILGLLQIIAIQVFNLPWPYVMQYVVLLSTGIFGFNLLIEFNRIYSEKRDLEEKIDIDTLTTAYNRNKLEKTQPNQYDVLILMDLDNFKSYNDRYGHQQGDQLLIKVTNIVKNNLRQQDLVVRYGGDEFLILLSEISIIDAEQVAIRIHNQFEASVDDEQVSVSYGIERMVHSLDSDLDKADRLMYAMKHAKNYRGWNKNQKQDK
jgi:diguanylate cyclase (GGDEF)-like protein